MMYKIIIMDGKGIYLSTIQSEKLNDVARRMVLFQRTNSNLSYEYYFFENDDVPTLTTSANFQYLMEKNKTILEKLDLIEKDFNKW